jgi:hypothetical protein
MKVLMLLVACTLFGENNCPNNSPVGKWKIAHHGDFPKGIYGHIELNGNEKLRTLTIDQCGNFWIVQASDTVDYGKWKLNRRGNSLSLKYTFSSSKTLKSGARQRTPLCFSDSISFFEDLPGRKYPDEDGPRESTYCRIAD